MSTFAKNNNEKEHNAMIQSFRRQLTIALLREKLQETMAKDSVSYDPEWPWWFSEVARPPLDVDGNDLHN